VASWSATSSATRRVRISSLSYGVAEPRFFRRNAPFAPSPPRSPPPLNRPTTALGLTSPHLMGQGVAHPGAPLRQLPSKGLSHRIAGDLEREEEPVRSGT
jgi:hypothetical protein